MRRPVKQEAAFAAGYAAGKVDGERIGEAKGLRRAAEQFHGRAVRLAADGSSRVAVVMLEVATILGDMATEVEREGKEGT